MVVSNRVINGQSLSPQRPLYLKTLHLRQFRNYQDQRVDFSSPKTILVGDNAQGKSNLLEAVELLSALRSHRSARDRDLVRNGETVGQVSAQVDRGIGPVDLAVTFRVGSRRTVAVNGEAQRRQVDFLGILNAVQFSSLDLELVRGGPTQRRDWVDGLLIQLEPIYARILQQYTQVLRQRNALLKQIKQGQGETVTVDAGAIAAQLAVWDAQLATTGARVARRRARVLQRLAPIAQRWHEAISGRQETLTVQYAPNVAVEKADDPAVAQQAFLEKIHQRAIAEKYQGTSLVGPHRDDVELKIDNTPARQYGSQGQQRTLVLALKLSELELIEAVVGEPPLLLLDDVLAELDLNRQRQLLDAIHDRFQTLMTTTHLGAFDPQWLRASQILTVKAGSLLPAATGCN